MNKNRIIFYCKKQICAFMSGLLFFLSANGNVPVRADVKAQDEIADKKELAIEWVQSISENMMESYEFGLSNATWNAGAVLRKEGRSVNVPLYDEWEAEFIEKNVDESAHVTWGSGDVDELANLWEMQNSDGGFGLTQEYTSDLYDTFLAVAAAASVKESISGNEIVTEEQLYKATEYIRERQNQDGGFGYTDTDISREGLSAEIGVVLSELGIEDEKFYERLDKYCVKVFETVFTEENFLEQAQIARYLYRREKIENREKIETQLLNVQKENGSVFDDLQNTLQYILLLSEIQDYNTLKLRVQEFTCESDSYVLEEGKEQKVKIQTRLECNINQKAEAIIRYTIFEDGKEKTVQEKECLLSPDVTEYNNLCEMMIIPTEGYEYTGCVELRIGEESCARYEMAYTLHKREHQELILTAEYGNTKTGEISLSWNDISDEDDRYDYRLFQKKEDGEWESCSTWDGEEKVKVLNVYPTGQNHLSRWMNTTVSGEEESAGKGLIDVEAVAFSEYNAKADTILRDENNKYKYDVIMIGSADCNGGWDLSDTAWQETQQFVDSGRGILFGHDTVVDNKDQVHKNLARFGEQLGITFHRAGSAIGARSVEVIKEGFLTSYPWKISGKLEIPYSHSSGQFVEGELGKDTKEWIRFEGIQADDDAYLISKNQLAMIQTGHSNGQATDDERKILANTLFYLKQMTNKTSATDKSVCDEEKPEIASITSISENHAVMIQAVDHGTEYQYYVEAVSGVEEENNRRSNELKVEAVTGIKGFIVCVNDQETLLGNMAEYDMEGNLISELSQAQDGALMYSTESLQPGESAWLHVCAVDYAGNISDEYVQKIENAQKAEKEYLNLPYAIYASGGEVQLYCCDANVSGDIYAEHRFCFQGSSIHLNARAVSPGMLSIAGGILDIREKVEGAQEERIPDYMDEILEDMGETDELECMSAYNSTDIHVPTLCKTTTGAWCNDIRLCATLVSEDSISFNANTIQCGDKEPVVLASKTGNIHFQATTISGCGLIYAPNGTVTINVSQFDYKGTIIAKEVKIQAGYYNQNQ